MSDRVTGPSEENLLDGTHGPLTRDLDEVVVLDAACVHLERTDRGAWWLRIDRRDGTAIVVNLAAKRPGTTVVRGMAEVDG